MRFTMIILILLLYPTIGFSTTDTLQGEWKKSCHRLGEDYFTARLAFIGNESVIFWKKYSDSDCSKLEAEHWLLQEFRLVGESSRTKGALEIDAILIDGGGVGCPHIFQTALITEEGGEKLLYTGTKPIHSPCQDGPEQRWMISEEDPVPWHFHSPLINISVETYTNLLNRGFSHFGYWYEQKKGS